jgi:SAM-dependent MidA family methyltransferase
MNALAKELCRQISQRGPMPFAAFMGAALYHPDLGYYRRPLGQVGKRGDFITSVSVGPLFGELLAFQFARWLEAERGTVHLVETGAHDGQLAHDILETLEDEAPALFARAEYWLIEPSAARREAQQKKLARFQNIRWHEGLANLHQRVRGVIFSNELLDALPVHPLAWNAQARRWEEMAVTVQDERFVWTRLIEPQLTPPALPSALLDALPDGYVIELGHAARNWWREAAAALAAGRLMTIDYGGVIEELLSPMRHTGTLRAYSGHRIGADVLANPGEQDITAQVNFTEIIQTGETAGLKTEQFCTQNQFLTAIAREWWKGSDSLPPQKVRQFQTHLGRPFKVLVQARR